MRPFVLDGEIIEKVKDLKKYAEKNIFTNSDMVAMMKQEKEPVGLNSDHFVNIPYGYRVVFSIEEHPGGWCRHISMSVDRPKMLPSPAAVTSVMQLLGFVKKIVENEFWEEEYAPGCKAINIVELM